MKKYKSKKSYSPVLIATSITFISLFTAITAYYLYKKKNNCSISDKELKKYIKAYNEKFPNGEGTNEEFNKFFAEYFKI